MSWLGRFWNSPPALHWTSSFLIQLSALAGLLVAAVWLAGQPVFALRSVQVLSTGPEIHHLSEEEIRQSVQSTSVGTALTRPLADLQASLQAYPWVRQASVRRVWPNRLMIWIEEHQPVAIWTDGRLINRQGELFWVDQSPRAIGLVPGCRLPPLSGPVGSHDRVLSRAQTLEQLFAAQGFSLSQLSLSDQFSWNAALHRGPELVLGRDTLPRSQEDRAQAFSQHLAWLTQSLQPSASASGRAAVQVTSVDLRYANGFAFRTAPGTARRGSDNDADGADQPNCLVFNREGRRIHDS
ncbi:MAG: cell division protein FtsQ/DivIB [Burkholderiaceae bacterium]